jgi:hypothetical protein
MKIISLVIARLLYLFPCMICASVVIFGWEIYRPKINAIANEKLPSLPHVQSVSFSRPVSGKRTQEGQDGVELELLGCSPMMVIANSHIQIGCKDGKILKRSIVWVSYTSTSTTSMVSPAGTPIKLSTNAL